MADRIIDSRITGFKSPEILAQIARIREICENLAGDPPHTVSDRIADWKLQNGNGETPWLLQDNKSILEQVRAVVFEMEDCESLIRNQLALLEQIAPAALKIYIEMTEGRDATDKALSESMATLMGATDALSENNENLQRSIHPPWRATSCDSAEER